LIDNRGSSANRGLRSSFQRCQKFEFCSAWSDGWVGKHCKERSGERRRQRERHSGLNQVWFKKLKAGLFSKQARSSWSEQIQPQGASDVTTIGFYWLCRAD
jgi:hypothetical protein